MLTVAGEVGDSVSAGSSSSSTDSATSETATDSGSGTETSSSSGSSSAFITMASTSTLSVTASIAEADIGSVKTGQEAEITLSASDETMTGTVSEISPEGTTSSNVVQYEVTIAVATRSTRPAWGPR